MSRDLRGLYSVIENNSVRDFLRATPYPAGGESSEIDNFLNKNREVFFDEIYISSKKEQDEFENLDRRINQRHNHLILLYGYKGCGKTTFIHKYARHLRNQNIRDIFYNFDSYGNTDPINHTITKYIFGVLYDDIMKNNGVVCDKWYEIWEYQDNKCFFCNCIDSDRNFSQILDSVKEIKNARLCGEVQEKKLEEINKIIYDNMSISEKLILTILVDIASRLVYKKGRRCIMVFDNLDVIYSTTQIENFTKSCSQFLNDAQYIFRNITYKEQQEEGIYKNLLQDYYLIFVMRETTNTMFIEHFNDRNFIGHPIDVSKIYDKSSIIEKRCDYVMNNKENIHITESTRNEFSLIRNLFRDEYIESYIFKIFNDDIRTGINALTEITFDKNYLQDSINIRNVKELYLRDTRFASRGIIFHEIFKLFITNGYFDMIKKTEYFFSIEEYDDKNRELTENKNKSDNIIFAINISRIILTYLFNFRRDEDDNDTAVQISRIYEDLSKLSHCENGDGRDILEIVNQSLIDLFDLRNSSFWNHLITFDGLGCEPVSELSNQLDMFLSKKYEYRNYGYVRITTSGYMYLNTVLTHFEYFSVRNCRKSDCVPLFLPENVTMCSSELYKFEKIINFVWKEVEECWKKLMKFYVEIFEKKCKYTIDSFLGSRYVYHNKNDEYIKRPLFHIERVAHSHISYLDAFRMYAFWILEVKEENADDIFEKKKDINRRLVHAINRYISLISEGDDLKASPTSTNLVNNYKKCIKKISNNDQWDDFITRIDNNTGNSIEDESDGK